MEKRLAVLKMYLIVSLNDKNFQAGEITFNSL